MLVFVIIVQFSTQRMETLLALFIKENHHGDSMNLTVAAIYLYRSFLSIDMNS